MIRANELRIGNLLMDVISGEWMEVDELGDNVSAKILDSSKYPLPDGWQMGGIPLTQKVLQLCSKNYTVFYYQPGPNSTTIQLDGIRVDISESIPEDADILIKGGGVRNLAKLKYLHQLQNVYFVLTGRELKIKL